MEFKRKQRNSKLANKNGPQNFDGNQKGANEMAHKILTIAVKGHLKKRWDHFSFNWQRDKNLNNCNLLSKSDSPRKKFSIRGFNFELKKRKEK